MSGYGRGGQGSPDDYLMQKMMFQMTLDINRQCFKECVTNFSSDKLSAQESTCIVQCAKRQSGAFMAMNDIQNQAAAKGGAGLF